MTQDPHPPYPGRAPLVIAHWESIVWWSNKQIIELFCMLNNPMPNHQWQIAKATLIEEGIFNLFKSVITIIAYSKLIWLYMTAYFFSIYS